METSSRGRSYLKMIENELNARRPVIGMVGGAGDGKVDHFVVITGESSSGDFSISDPAKKASPNGFFLDASSHFPSSKSKRYQLGGIVTMHYYGPNH